MSYNNSVNGFTPVASSASTTASRRNSAKSGVSGENNFARMLGDTPISTLKAGMQTVQHVGGEMARVIGVPSGRSQIGVQNATQIARETLINHPKRPLGRFELPETPRAGGGMVHSLNSFKGSQLTEDDTSALAVRTASHRKGGELESAVMGKIKDSETLGVLKKGINAMPFGVITDTVGNLTSSVREHMNLGSAKSPYEVIGVLAEKFESGTAGISAIGYDRNGGTSYGKFQISSKSGSMKQFIQYLSSEAPDIAEKLEDAGQSNTGGRRGKMPEIWKGIAEQEPERFEKLQDEFIKQSHFTPALEAVAKSTGIAVEAMGSAFKEVLFSTAVQHGPYGAARIFSKAIGRIGQDKLVGNENLETVQKAGEDLIKQVYTLRSGQFTSSTPEVQAAVKNRLKAEMGMALNMFKGGNIA